LLPPILNIIIIRHPGGKIVPVPGGVLIKDAAGAILREPCLLLMIP